MLTTFFFSFWDKTGSVVKNKTLHLQLITAVSDCDPISQELSTKHDSW